MNQGPPLYRTSAEAGWESGFCCAEPSRFSNPATMFSAIHKSSTDRLKEKPP